MAARSCSDHRAGDARRPTMPTYEFRCLKCNGSFEKIMTVAQREKARPVCPSCRSRKVEPVFGGFFAKTSRKS
jgi:putative FmdB family regulatory protein